MTDEAALASVKAEFDERMKGMPEYVGKAMIPEVAYAEAPGVVVDSAKGTASIVGSLTAFDEKPGDKLVIMKKDGTVVAQLIWGQDAGSVGQAPGQSSREGMAEDQLREFSQGLCLVLRLRARQIAGD